MPIVLEDADGLPIPLTVPAGKALAASNMSCKAPCFIMQDAESCYRYPAGTALVATMLLMQASRPREKEAGIKQRQIICTPYAVGCLFKHAGLSHDPALAEPWQLVCNETARCALEEVVHACTAQCTRQQYRHSPQGSKTCKVAATHCRAARGALEVCIVAALKASHLISLQGHTHRHVSTPVDCSSGVEHRQGCLHAALNPRHGVPDRRCLAVMPTWCQAASPVIDPQWYAGLVYPHQCRAGFDYAV